VDYSFLDWWMRARNWGFHFGVLFGNFLWDSELFCKVFTDLSRIAVDAAQQNAESQELTDLHYLVSLSRQREVHLMKNCENGPG
jgi:hypothetical protein